MDLNNKSKKYVKIDWNTWSDKNFAMLDGVESDLEDDIDEFIYDSDTEFVFEGEDSENDAVCNDQP